VNILQALNHPHLFKKWFDAPTWDTWRCFLAALFGLPMNEAQADIYRQCTSRTTLPSQQFGEAWLIVGRRGGKSQILALTAVFLAAFKDHKRNLGPGEYATIKVLAADRLQARVIFRFVGGLLREVPLLEKLIERETHDTYELTNRVIIEISTTNSKTIRGFSLAAVLADEIAFWRDDTSSDPDEEVLTALRPGLMNLPGAMLLCASTPYAKKGALWNAHQSWYGKDDAPALVWKAPTRCMNPSVSEEYIARELEKDYAKNAAEYLVEFRSDLESYINPEAVRACVETGCFERPIDRRNKYWAFTDASGGSVDSMTLVICHKEGGTVRHDMSRERKAPFNPEAVVAEFADECKRYRIDTIYGDSYAGEWPRERFRAHGINYKVADLNRSELYVHLLPLITSRGIDILDDNRLVNQIISLERSTRGVRDKIDHPPGAHDDLSNALAGAAWLASTKAMTWAREKRQVLRTVPWGSEGDRTGTGWLGV
jgi:hypothetical protein